MKSRLLTLAVSLFGCLGIAAEETAPWPQFRGPGGAGIADTEKPPSEIGPEKNVRWKVAVPSGFSSPIVIGDLVVLTAFDQGKLFTIAYRRDDGAEAWRAQAPTKNIESFHKTESSPAASTPATDGQRIVSYFGSCGLICYDQAGKQQWFFELPTANVAGNFGSGVSPIIADGLVVLVRDQTRDAKILAVDVRTGELAWQRPRTSPASYCTPVIWNTPEGKQIAAAGHARMIGYDLKTGAEKWSVASIPAGCCSSPVVAGERLYFAGSSPGGSDDPDFKMPTFDSLLKDLDKDQDGSLSRVEGEKAFEGFFDNQDANRDGQVTRDEWDLMVKYMTEGQNAAFALRSGGSGDITESHVVWHAKRGLPYIASAILYRGQYVMVKDGGIVTAYDAATGKEVYQARAAASGKYYSSPVAANGKIYFVTTDGEVTVIEGGGAEPMVVAKNPSLGERVTATPAIAHDTLYIRTDGHLYAFGHAG